MKRLSQAGLLSALLLTILLCLSACGSNHPNTALKGTYASETPWSQEVFSFDGDEIVTVSSSAAGYTYYTQEGTYQIGESGDEITLSFSAPTGTAQNGNISYSGTYSFSKKEDYILIGDVRYNLTEEAATEQTEPTQEQEGESMKEAATEQTEPSQEQEGESTETISPSEQKENEPKESSESKYELPNLNGTYVIGTQWSQLSYTFSESGDVNVQASTNGYTYYSQAGTYQISADENEITFAFSSAIGTNRPSSMSYTGTHTFSRAENFVLIDGARYNLSGAETSGQAESPPEQKKAEQSDPIESPPTQRTLSGTYSIASQWSPLSYTFDENGVVTVSSSATGSTYTLRTGLYQIGEYGDKIRFEFPVSAATVQSGGQSDFETHLFSIGDENILIDGCSYHLEK